MNNLIEIYNPFTGEKTYVSEEKMTELAVFFHNLLDDQPIEVPKIVKRSSGRYPWGKKEDK